MLGTQQCTGLQFESIFESMYKCLWKLDDAGALRRSPEVTELCKGTPGVASARLVIASF